MFNSWVAILTFYFYCCSIVSSQTAINGVAVLAPIAPDTLRGTITFDQTVNGTTVTVNITGITTNPDGIHAINIFQFGDLRGVATTPFTPPGTNVLAGNSLGPHFNPTGAPHGCPENSTGNEGTLGNWKALGGSIQETKVLPLIQLSGSSSIIARGIALHERADDCIDPASSGSRIGFGVVGISKVPTGTTNTAAASPSTLQEASCLLQGTASCQGPHCSLGTAGVVTLSPTADGRLRVSAQIAGISTERGFHIHSFGDLRSTDGTSAGSHYNPDAAVHGLPGVTNTRHVGDLGSVRNFDQAFGYYDYVLDYQPLTSLNFEKIVGRAIVLHALLDHGSDPSCGTEATTTGAAGKRDYFCVIGFSNNANQSVADNLLPSPQMPSGFVMNSTWVNVPCSSTVPAPATVPAPENVPTTSPVDLAALGYIQSATLTAGLTAYWVPLSSTDTALKMALRATFSGWLGVAWSGGPYKMVGSEAIVGWAGATKSVGAYDLNAKAVGNIVPSTLLAVNETYIELVNGVTTVIFSRAVNGSRFPITQGLNTILGAMGPLPFPSFHSSYSTSSIAVDFTTGSSVETHEESLASVHGILMAIAWAVLLPFGMFFARYGRDIGPEGTWFKVHIAVQSVGYLIAWVAFIIALVMVEGDHFDTVWHGQLGFVLIFLTIPQVVYGIFRPHLNEGAPKTTQRRIFEVVHPWFGRLLILAALVQIFGGLSLVSAGGWIALYVFWLIALLIAGIILELRPRHAARADCAAWCFSSVPLCGPCCSDMITPTGSEKML